MQIFAILFSGFVLAFAQQSPYNWNSDLWFTNREQKPCACDKDPTVCDFNCCCDLDCSVQDSATFELCEDEGEILKNRQCSEINPLVRLYHIPILELELTVSDVLCIEYNNFPSYQSSQPSAIVSLEELQRYQEVLPEVSPTMGTSFAHYQRGSNLYRCHQDFINNKLCQLEILTIPQRMGNGICSGERPLRFLSEEQFSCFRRIENTSEFIQSCQNGGLLPSYFIASSYYLGLRVVADLIWLNRLNQTNSIEFDRDNGSAPTIPIKPICRDSFTKADIPCQNDIQTSSNDSICVNVVTAVSWIFGFSYNGTGTDGIRAIQAEIYLKNLSQSDVLDGVLSQSFSVSFRQMDELETGVIVNSGQPGYLFGKPILAGKLQVEIVEEQLNLQRFSKTTLRINLPFSSDNWLNKLDMVMSNSHECSNSHRSPVLFGENTLTVCLVPFEASCEMTQLAIKNILLGSFLKHDHIGMFGNSNVSRPGEWLAIRSNFSEGSAVSGNPRQGFCDSLQASLILRISFVKTGSAENPQNQIIDAIYEFETPRQYALHCSNDNCLSMPIIPVKFAVVFDDVSAPSTPHYAPTRQIEHYLAADFFYPFFMNSANAKARSLESTTVLFALLLYAGC